MIRSELFIRMDFEEFIRRYYEGIHKLYTMHSMYVRIKLYVIINEFAHKTTTQFDMLFVLFRDRLLQIRYVK